MDKTPSDLFQLKKAYLQRLIKRNQEIKHHQDQLHLNPPSLFEQDISQICQSINFNATPLRGTTSFEFEDEDQNLTQRFQTPAHKEKEVAKPVKMYTLNQARSKV